MIDFIVSGQIPGLHIQITFLLWEVAFAALVAFAAVRIMRRVRQNDASSTEEESAEQTPQAA
jgi:hypothetical protein